MTKSRFRMNTIHQDLIEYALALIKTGSSYLKISCDTSERLCDQVTWSQNFNSVKCTEVNLILSQS